MYADTLRQQFPELDPVVDDLFLLEPHQIGLLRDRAPRRELAVVLRAHPSLLRYLVTRFPPITPYLAQLSHDPGDYEGGLAQAEQSLLWEIADFIVYQRAPALYDARHQALWTRAALVEAEPLADKVVIDAGAGTGKVSFTVAPIARTVFAVEPVSTLRSYMRDRARNQGLGNVFVIDGYLHEIPLPADSADLLVTHRAIGWNLPAELADVERVVRDGGVALHLTGQPYPAGDDAPLHGDLLAAGYEEHSYEDGAAQNRKYFKQI